MVKRWQRSGINWEGRQWRVSDPLALLLNELEFHFPFARTGDGTVASRIHDANNPTSDHRPKPVTGPGIVRAVDFGEIGSEGDDFAEELRRNRDPRVRYVIHRDRIFYGNYRTPQWTWVEYSGSNPHDTHVHVSLDWNHDGNTDPWMLFGGGGENVEQVLRLFVTEAIAKGWLKWPDEGTYWLNLCKIPTDPQWRANFEPAWNRWKSEEGVAIKAPGPAGPPGGPGPPGPPGTVAPGTKFTGTIS